MSAREVGRVAGIARYPVKSMAGEPMSSADISWYGVAGDRRWAFVRGGLEHSGFPWLTMRENPAMGRYVPRFIAPGSPDTSATVVMTPSGIELDVVDPALAEELGHASRVIRQSRGVFDAFPLSLISTSTLEALSSIVGFQTDARRFRPNIVIETTDGTPFMEDSLVGAELTIGTMKMRVDKRDKRCVMINVDPDDSSRNPGVLRAVAQERQACLGVYGSVVQPGVIMVGDVVVAGD